MADVRISELPIEQQPLQTDVLPIVNNNVTKQVSIENISPTLLKVGSDVYTNFIYTFTSQTTNVLSGATSGSSPTIQILDDQNPSLRIGALSGLTLMFDETNSGDFLFTGNTNVVITPLSSVTITKNSIITGNNNVSGNTTIGGGLMVNGNTILNNQTIINNQSSNNIVAFTGNQTTFNRDVFIDGWGLSFSNGSAITGSLSSGIDSLNISSQEYGMNLTSSATTIFDNFNNPIVKFYEGNVSGEAFFMNVVTIGNYDTGNSYLQFSTNLGNSDLQILNNGELTSMFNIVSSATTIQDSNQTTLVTFQDGTTTFSQPVNIVNNSVGFKYNDTLVGLFDTSPQGLNISTEGNNLTITSTLTSIDGGFILSNPTTPPTNSGDTGTKGTITYDDNYLYVCVNTDTWKRVELLGW